MFKTLVIATFATLSLAADYPLPDVPQDFVGDSIHYLFQNNRLIPTHTFSTQKWSSKLNKIYDAAG